jgi:hypothetical protein
LLKIKARLIVAKKAQCELSFLSLQKEYPQACFSQGDKTS